MADSSSADPPAAAHQLNSDEAKAAAPVKTSKKGRVSRPERPSRESLTKDIADVNVQITECQKRIQEIKDSIDNQRQGKHGYEKEIQDARLKIAATIAQFKAIMEQKKAMRDQLGAADEARKRMRDEARSLRDRLPFVKVEQIDEEVKKLEYRMAHTTLTLNEEKKVVQQIRDLNKSKEFVKDYTERMDKISADESSRSELTAKIKEKDDQLNALKQQEHQQKAAVDALWAKSRASVTDVPTLIEEREKLYAQVKMHREKIKQLHAEFRDKEDAFWAKETEWRAQQAEDRKKAYEEREAYRKEKEARRKAWEAENYVEPYTDEIIICDQLTVYVQKLSLPGADGEGETETQKTAVQAEGFGKMVVAKKNRGDEELDNFFGGVVKTKKKKGQRQRDRGERFVSHSLDALTSFGKIKVTAPTSSGEFEDTLAKIKEKKEEFIQLQSAEREKRAAAKEKESQKKEGGVAEETGDVPAEDVSKDGTNDANAADGESKDNEAETSEGKEGDEAEEDGEGDGSKVKKIVTKFESFKKPSDSAAEDEEEKAEETTEEVKEASD